MIEYCESTLGTTLGECRTISGLSLTDVSVQSGMPITHLVDIESGGRGPTKEILRQLMEIYEPAIRALHAHPRDKKRREEDTRRDDEHSPQIDWISLLIESESMTNRQLLDEVATAVRELRNLEQAAAVHMREAEADLLVSMLDLGEPDLACHIMRAFGLSIKNTQDFISGAITRATRRAHGGESEYLARLVDIRILDDGGIVHGADTTLLEAET